MLCNKCGMQNPEGSAFCVSCGAPLDATEQSQQNTDFAQQYQEPVQQPVQEPIQQQYQQPYEQQYQQPVQQPVQQPYQQPVQQPYQQPVQQYQQPQSPYPQQSYGYAPARDPRLDNPGAIKGAKVLYIITGAIACLCFLLPFLPSVSALGTNLNVFSIGRLASGLGSAIGNRSAQSGGVFIIVMFVIPMALQVPWAILSFMRKRPAGVFGLISSIIYFIASCIWLGTLTSESIYRSIVTGVPYFMLMFAIAGIVLSIIQLVKKKYF